MNQSSFLWYRTYLVVKNEMLDVSKTSLVTTTRQNKSRSKHYKMIHHMYLYFLTEMVTLQ